MRHSPKVLTKQEIMMELWGDEEPLKHPALDIAEKWQSNQADTNETIQQAL